MTTQDSFASESGHWYRPDGTPAYTVTGKNGNERATTLRDARELGLVPSVTSILKLEAAPALTNWLVRQGMLSALTLPRSPGEDEDTFLGRALIDSREQAKKAAERGTYLHGLLEWAITLPREQAKRDLHRDDEPIILPVLDFLAVNFPGYKWSPEKSFASELGFGGKVDLWGECDTGHVVIDFKTKADIEPGKRLAYDNHSTQLAAYAYGLGHPDARCLNLFVSTTKPGLIVPVEFPRDEIQKGWEAFQCLLKLWKVRRGL